MVMGVGSDMWGVTGFGAGSLLLLFVVLVGVWGGGLIVA